jgi:hypothetical protein
MQRTPSLKFIFEVVLEGELKVIENHGRTIELAKALRLKDDSKRNFHFFVFLTRFI